MGELQLTAIKYPITEPVKIPVRRYANSRFETDEVTYLINYFNTLHNYLLLHDFDILPSKLYKFFNL